MIDIMPNGIFSTTNLHFHVSAKVQKILVSGKIPGVIFRDLGFLTGVMLMRFW